MAFPHTSKTQTGACDLCDSHAKLTFSEVRVGEHRYTWLWVCNGCYRDYAD